MAELRDVPDDIYKLFDTDNPHEIDPANLDALCKNIADLVKTRLGPARQNADPLRFSILGRPDRQVWYAANTPPEQREKLGGKQQLKFLYGDIIEQLLLFLVKEAGHTVEMEQAELEVDGVFGHIDAVIDGVTTDVKSASPMAYQKFERGTLFESDAFGYIGQISSYASIVTPETGGAFLAMDKVDGSVCVLNVGSSITNSFSVGDRIRHLRVVTESKEKPPRCYPDEEDGKSGNRKLGLNCSYCAHKFDCWSDANNGQGLRTFLYSGKPRFLTQVVRQPDVLEV
jgi:hypothetical protein